MRHETHERGNGERVAVRCSQQPSLPCPSGVKNSLRLQPSVWSWGWLHSRFSRRPRHLLPSCIATYPLSDIFYIGQHDHYRQELLLFLAPYRIFPGVS